MLLIPTYVAASGIHGLGVYAAKKIKKGQKVWIFDPHWDHQISDQDFDGLAQVQKKFLKIYAYHNQHHGPGFILESDNGRFMNHSEAPNLDFANLDGFALRDIEKDEELTCDYRQCCDEHKTRIAFRGVKKTNGAGIHAR